MYRHETRPEMRPEPAPSARGSLDGRHAYRLKHWPQIPERFRTARVLGACSRMSLGPVTANWLLDAMGLAPAAASQLMSELIAQDAIDCIDLGPRTPARPALRRVPPSAVEKLRARLAQRFPWKHAAVAVAVCLGVSAALDDRLTSGVGPIAIPDLPAVSG